MTSKAEPKCKKAKATSIAVLQEARGIAPSSETGPLTCPGEALLCSQKNSVSVDDVASIISVGWPFSFLFLFSSARDLAWPSMEVTEFYCNF